MELSGIETAVRNTGVDHLVRPKPDSFIVAAEGRSGGRRQTWASPNRSAGTPPPTRTGSPPPPWCPRAWSRRRRPSCSPSGRKRCNPCAAPWPSAVIGPASTAFTCRHACPSASCGNWPLPLPQPRRPLPRRAAGRRLAAVAAAESRFRVDASGRGPGLNHSHYSALEVKNALVDWQRQHWGSRSSVDLDDPDLRLHLHLGGGERRGPEAVLSLEGSGGSLHRRGYRAALGLAPLKENLAAGLIALTGWDGRCPLADPLCGSGTLLIEAACRALGRAPASKGEPRRGRAPSASSAGPISTPPSGGRRWRPPAPWRGTPSRMEVHPPRSWAWSRNPPCSIRPARTPPPPA